MRAVVDTNVWVSALIRRDGVPALLAQVVRRGLYRPVCSRESFDELALVLQRDRIRRAGVSSLAAAEFLLNLRAAAELVEFVSPVQLCRDPKDDWLIALATSASADCIVTRDDDLKGDDTVRGFLAERNIALYTVREFARLIGVT